jgi:hypothetical protein
MEVQLWADALATAILSMPTRPRLPAARSGCRAERWSIARRRQFSLRNVGYRVLLSWHEASTESLCQEGTHALHKKNYYSITDYQRVREKRGRQGGAKPSYMHIASVTHGPLFQIRSPSSTCHPCSASCPSKIRYQVKNGQDCPGGGRKISMPNIGPSIVPISPIKTVRARAMRPKLNCKAVAGPLGSV